jgi:pyridoxal phosphate enzyme (YggS family)
MNIKNNLLEFHDFTSRGGTLVAVSKTKPVADIAAAYDAGQRDFGENKVQELRDKQPELPADIRWHMIGHLQTNKVKYIAPFIFLIHSVDSLRLLEEINKQAARQKRVISCLLQIHIAEEETKFGLDAGELEELLSSDALATMKNIKIAGLMGMATFTDDDRQVRKEFAQLKTLLDKSTTPHNDKPNVDLHILSMGMSGDYKTAIEMGSTMIRVGSKIFGERH